jgi:hypothetical protein
MGVIGWKTYLKASATMPSRLKGGKKILEVLHFAIGICKKK